jgi:hypothetical protein
VKIHLAILTASLTLIATPAYAEPIPATQAAAELASAVTATNNAEAYTWTTSHGQAAKLNRASMQYEESGYSQLKVIGSVSYFPIRWPSDRIRVKVLGARYLNNPALVWAFTSESLGGLEIALWPDVIAPRSDRLGSVYSSPDASQITFADKAPTPGGGFQYTITAGSTTSVTTDSAGRISSLQDYRSQNWNYVAPTVNPPDPATTLPYPTVGRAIQSARLGQTIRDLARRIAATRTRSLTALRNIADEVVVIHNAGGEDEQMPVYVKLRLRNVANGVRIFRKNPITGTFHEWRVTEGARGWRAYRTAP